MQQKQSPKIVLKQAKANRPNILSMVQYHKPSSGFQESSTCSSFGYQMPKRKKNKQNLVYKSQFPVVAHEEHANGKQELFLMKIEDFEIGQFLGKGAYGSVRVARHTKTGTFYCIKTLNRKKIQQHLDRFLLGLKLQLQAKHPNIVQVYGLIVQKQQVLVIMELCVDGNLGQLLKNYTNNRRKSIKLLTGIANGLQYLHNKNIMHRDLKLENIMICYDLPKISDFDLAVQLDESMKNTRKTVCGSPAYFSPEMITKCPYSFKADIWCLGIIFYEILCGYFPFKYQNLKDIEQIMQKNMERPPKGLDELAKNLLYCMLQKKEKVRYNINEVAIHPFLKQGERFQHL